MTDLYGLEQRVAAIEARQRAAFIHDPWCPEVIRAKAGWMPTPIADPESCCCWLSELP